MKDIKLNIHLSLLYENIHNKKRFCFHFGSIGKINKKSLLAFWLIYFSLLFKFISEVKLINMKKI